MAALLSWPALLALLVVYVVLAAIFFGAASRPTRYAKWVGLAAIAAAGPFFYWLGAFSDQFSAGICYSSSVEMIANAVEKTDSPQDLAKRIRKLPLHGYETKCSEVEAAARELPNAGSQ